MAEMNRIEKLVILGGGTAGLMTAAAFSRFLSDGKREITLVESDEIGIVGVGEATIPPIRDFNHRLGIDERAFIRETGATIKPGIEFEGWGKIGERYLHPFGKLGHDFQGVDFHQYWLKHRQGSLEDYWLASHLAQQQNLPARCRSAFAVVGSCLCLPLRCRAVRCIPPQAIGGARHKAD